MSNGKPNSGRRQPSPAPDHERQLRAPTPALARFHRELAAGVRKPTDMDSLRAAASWEQAALEVEADGQDACDLWLTVPVAAAGFFELRQGTTAHDVTRCLRRLHGECARDDRYRFLCEICGPTVNPWPRLYRRAVAECERCGFSRKVVETLLKAIGGAEQQRFIAPNPLPPHPQSSRGLGRRRRLEWKGSRVQ